MSEIKSLIDSLRAMELPKGAESLLSSIGSKASDLERDRDDLKGKVETRQTENAKLKERAQTAEGERDDLKGKVPADGAVTLSKADAERLEAYKALGKVDEVKATLERVGTLEQEKSRQEREATIRIAGFDPKKLERILGGAGLKVTGEGDDMKVLVTKDDTETALDEWAEAEEVTDLLNVARLEQTTRPIAMPQAGRAPAPKGKTLEQRTAEVRSQVSI